MAAADPVGSSLVASLARPGGNVTGLSALSTDLSGKRLQLARELVPKAIRVAVLAHAGSSATQEVKEAGDLPGAFTTMQRERAQALIVQINRVSAGQHQAHRRARADHVIQ
jgi:ABC-type uncharacterized transport system substrate-binding protein